MLEQHKNYQAGRGQAILCEVALQMSRQLQGQRMYFLPGGGALMGYKYLMLQLNETVNLYTSKTVTGTQDIIINLRTVASLHTLHLTTCCCSFPSMLIMAWQTLQLTTGTPPCAATYGGGSSANSDPGADGTTPE